MKTLAKIQNDKWLGGVCSGFAYMLGAPTWMVRLAVTLALLFGVGSPLPIYVLLWVFMPRWQMDPRDYDERTRRSHVAEPCPSTPPADPRS